MDDYSVSSLQESRNEWCARLINILTPLVIEGVKSIFNESWTLCQENDEREKYLMTFQNFLGRIPKWNTAIVEEETNRITEKSNCGYLTDLISCVHIIQLKSLTCMRVGNKQKKVDIAVPSLSEFIHKIYINTARKMYTNIYLFERNIDPLQIQKHNRELELIIREQILNTIRDNIPVEDILKVYLDETIEDDVEVEEKEEIISTEPVEEETREDIDANDEENIEPTTTVQDEEVNANHIDTKLTDDQIESMIQFNNIDEAISVDKIISEIDAPKTEARLEQISQERNIARKLEEDDDDDEDRLVIGDKIKLTEMDVHDLEKPKILNRAPIGMDEIEILT
jgi:hypothetical protein